MKFTRYIPEGYTVIERELGILVAYRLSPYPHMIGYYGSRKKPSVNKYASRPEQILEYIDKWIKAVSENLQRDIDRKAELKKQRENITADQFYKIGDILVNSWGYEQTNVDFYRVIGVKGKTITYVKIPHLIIEESMYAHGMACDVVPDTSYTPGPGAVLLKSRVKENGYLSQPNSYYYIHRWNGEPMYKSWYA